MYFLIGVPLASILILFALLGVWSYPGKPKPFLDEKGNPLLRFIPRCGNGSVDKTFTKL